MQKKSKNIWIEEENPIKRKKFTVTLQKYSRTQPLEDINTLNYQIVWNNLDQGDGGFELTRLAMIKPKKLTQKKPQLIKIYNHDLLRTKSRRSTCIPSIFGISPFWIQYSLNRSGMKFAIIFERCSSISFHTSGNTSANLDYIFSGAPLMLATSEYMRWSLHWMWTHISSM